MLMVDENHDTVRVPSKGSMLYFKEDQVIWVTSLDVNELIRGACINVSVIQVYICYLVELQATVQGGYITFLCPHRVSAVECKRGFLNVVAYVKQALISELKKEHQAHLILVLYNEDNHWILMAIDLSVGVLFQFDPLAQQQPRQLSCDNVFNLAYRAYRSRIKGGSQKIVFHVVHVECAQQTSGLEYGYYVMKYMHEIVKESRNVKQIKEYITSRSTSPYSQKELDEIREEWARFFRENLLLS